MKKSLLTLPLLLLSTQTFAAKETLRVLVVYDGQTINTVSALNTSSEQLARSKQIITDLKKSYSNSGLSSHYDFQLVGSLKQTFSTEFGLGDVKLKYIAGTYEGNLLSRLNIIKSLLVYYKNFKNNIKLI